MPSKKAHMHHKFMVIDSAHVVSGSYNFVTKSFSGNHENVVAIKSPAMAASFVDHWRELRYYEP
jgi:phosphatidylserine/phosphatidylglycerophosphate/cardiolipin synthase-like enzyme